MPRLFVLFDGAAVSVVKVYAQIWATAISPEGAPYNFVRNEV